MFHLPRSYRTFAKGQAAAQQPTIEGGVDINDSEFKTELQATNVQVGWQCNLLPTTTSCERKSFLSARRVMMSQLTELMSAVSACSCLIPSKGSGADST